MRRLTIKLLCVAIALLPCALSCSKKVSKAKQVEALEELTEVLVEVHALLRRDVPDSWSIERGVEQLSLDSFAANKNDLLKRLADASDKVRKVGIKTSFDYYTLNSVVLVAPSEDRESVLLAGTGFREIAEELLKLRSSAGLPPIEFMLDGKPLPPDTAPAWFGREALGESANFFPRKDKLMLLLDSTWLIEWDWSGKLLSKSQLESSDRIHVIPHLVGVTANETMCGIAYDKRPNAKKRALIVLALCVDAAQSRWQVVADLSGDWKGYNKSEARVASLEDGIAKRGSYEALKIMPSGAVEIVEQVHSIDERDQSMAHQTTSASLMLKGSLLYAKAYDEITPGVRGTLGFRIRNDKALIPSELIEGPGKKLVAVFQSRRGEAQEKHAAFVISADGGHTWMTPASATPHILDAAP